MTSVSLATKVIQGNMQHFKGLINKNNAAFVCWFTHGSEGPSRYMVSRRSNKKKSLDAHESLQYISPAAFDMRNCFCLLSIVLMQKMESHLQPGNVKRWKVEADWSDERTGAKRESKSGANSIPTRGLLV